MKKGRVKPLACENLKIMSEISTRKTAEYSHCNSKGGLKRYYDIKNITSKQRNF